MIRTILIASLLLTCTAIAQTPRSVAAPEPLVMLPGSASCGEWYAARQGRGQYPWESLVNWFDGFIAGHNLYAQRPTNTMITAEPNDVILWLDTYCQKNPTNSLAQAAAAYIAAHGGRDPLSRANVK